MADLSFMDGVINKASKAARTIGKKIGANASINGTVLNNRNNILKGVESTDDLLKANNITKLSDKLKYAKQSSEGNKGGNVIGDYYKGMSDDGKTYMNKAVRRGLGTAGVIGAPVGVGIYNSNKQDVISGDPY